MDDGELNRVIDHGKPWPSLRPGAKPHEPRNAKPVVWRCAWHDEGCRVIARTDAQMAAHERTSRHTVWVARRSLAAWPSHTKTTTSAST